MINGKRVHVGLLAMVGLFATAATAGAQGRGAPNDDYYRSFQIYYNGDYTSAYEAFDSAASGAILSNGERWIDSICYFTMMGECRYRMGDTGGALEQFTAATRLWLRYPDWLLRIQFPPDIDASNLTIRRPPRWAVSARRIQIANLPRRMGSRQGRNNTEQALRQGGVVSSPFVYPVDVEEVLRCMALALRRRAEILGPVAAHDPHSVDLMASLQGRMAPRNHWSQGWVSALLGMAYLGAGRGVEAAPELQDGVVIGGRFDHELTPMVLLELGKLAYRQGQHDVAANFFAEASLSAAIFEQYDVIAEALHAGSTNHLVAGGGTVYPLLAEAISWSQRGARPLEASLYLDLAENMIAQGDAAAATVALGQASSTMRRRELTAGREGLRHRFLVGHAHYLKGEVAQGSDALADVMAFQFRSSVRIFQIVLANRLAEAGTLTLRTQGQLYEEVLREPTVGDWNREPLETLTYLMAPVVDEGLEFWFRLALANKEPDQALVISDRIRRYRFFRSLPLGGRLLALRWIMEAPEESLTQTALLQRQDLLARFPQYSALQRESTVLREQLADLPLVPEDVDVQRQQSDIVNRLARVSSAQELLLHDIALRRVPSQLAFPPERSVGEIQEGLEPGQRVLSFLATRNNLYGFWLSKDAYTVWRIEGARELRGKLSEVLRTIGNYDRNQTIGLQELQDESWKEPAEQILAGILNQSDAAIWDEFDELIVVPDGILWYVPYEALPVDGEPLVSKVRIRCVPTVSLAIPDSRGHRTLGTTLVVTGRLFPRDTEQDANDAYEFFREALPDIARAHTQLRVPSGVLSTVVDQLVVLADMDNDQGGAYDWAPMQLDRGRAGGSLGIWMMLPWGAPDRLALPGFHTPAESALRRDANGNELFLASCALLANGSRTVLLSRWRTGGISSHELTREFVQELPHTSASEAWQRAVQVVWNSDLDVGREPRIETLPADADVTPRHPFFWSGFLLVDLGSKPLTEERVVAEGE